MSSLTSGTADLVDKTGWSATKYNKTAAFLLAAQPGERIAEFGCGSGEITLELQNRVVSMSGGAVIGVDLSESMITKAKQNGVKHAFVGDIQALEFPNDIPGCSEKFDAVFSNAVLHWCKRDPAGVLESARRILKPGGRIAAEMGGFMNCIGVRSTMYHVLRKRGYDPVSRDPWFFPSAEEYENLLTDAGFQVEHISLNPRFTPLTGGLAEWLRLFTRHSFLGDLSDEEAEEIIDEVAQICREDCQDKSGKWVMIRDGRRLHPVRARLTHAQRDGYCMKPRLEPLSLTIIPLRKDASERKSSPDDHIGSNEASLKFNGKDSSVDTGFSAAQAVPVVLDYYFALSLVLGGCCANVWAYEQLLMLNPRIGSALTFSQMLFITLQSLPTFLVFQKGQWIPRLKPRHVPLHQWAFQVVVLLTGTLFNNWAFAYSVPLTLLIVFRSAGLAVSMLFGIVFLKKRYSIMQITSVMTVTVGVVLATLSKPKATSTSTKSTIQTSEDMQKYLIGVTMLVTSLFLTAFLGMLQEKTYKKYGPCWKEGVFYTQVSSVSTNLVLTARKALSLCISVWWFNIGWNAQLGIGAGMVFLGSALFSMGSNANAKAKKE
ncbi:hypothetical protein C0995_000176 [Termitomyces sp. Mi166|nr:hypothetical protein C0995_000176 [Termitomyces sp. Mi166\